MFRPLCCRVIAATLLALAFTVAQAQYLMTPAANGTTFTGFITDTTISGQVASPITDQAALHALWTAWRLTAAEPTVDFTTKQVTVTTSLMSVRAGFHYEINVVKRETPVTILREQSSANGGAIRRFMVITDEAAWAAMWGNTDVPMLVDFTKEEVLYAATGTNNTGDWVLFRSVNETATRITATLHMRPYPDTNEDVHAQPYVFAVIAKSNKPVYFVDEGTGETIVPIISTFSDLGSLQPAPTTVVIKDVASWKNLYDKQMPAGAALPEVNFGENMALVVFSGKAGELMRVDIRDVREANDQLRVEYTLTPGGYLIDRGSTPNYPWAAVVVPKSDLPVTFTEVK
jgi:hypothetical protein